MDCVGDSQFSNIDWFINYTDCGDSENSMTEQSQ